MTANVPIILILGAGPNIGQAVARKFASKGYKVALAARSVKESDNSDSLLNIPSDFSKPEDVVNAFDQTKKTFGIPSVVVYNGRKPFISISSSSTD
jgi:NAD(P)-dependent dehydrogenase (short-subunit alcohol dehydrogenase family)